MISIRNRSVFGALLALLMHGAVFGANTPAPAPAAKAGQEFEAGHALAAQRNFVGARAEYARILDRKDAAPALRSLAQLCIAQTYAREGNLAAARTEYARLAAISNAPAHHRWEARERIRELERRQAGLPPRDPQAGRVRLPPLPQPAITLHVAPPGVGKDTNPGTESQPFATLERARDEIRSLKAKGTLPDGGVAVVVRGGDYSVTRTFTLAAEDSGTERAPVVFRAAKGAAPRFRGGVQLSGFQPVTDPALLARIPEPARRHVVQADLKACGVTNLLPLKLGGFASGNGFKTHPAHELFFNGQALQLARGPNDGFLRIADVAVKDGTKGYDRQGSKVGKFTYQGDRPAQWANEPDLLLYGYWFWDWADSYERVEAIDPAQRLITLARPFHTYGYSIGAPFYAINALSELDTPGEWYLDRAGGKVLFYPPSDPARATVELSLFAAPMVRMNDVAHVRFEGLTWELGSGDGIQINGGEDCLLAGCTVRHLAGNGVEIQGGTAHGLLGCDIYSMGRGGTIITGGNRKTLAPGRHFVENCDIHHLSRIDHTYTPAVLLGGVGNRLAHNRLHDVLSSAMRVEGNDHLVEFNEVFEAVQESDDQGGADMFGNPTYRGNVYRFNYWHHIGNWRATGEQPKCGQAGIRLDDAISGTLVYGNIFYRCSAGKLGFGGVQIHGGKDNILDNNLFAECAAAVSFTPWSEKRWQDFVKGKLEQDRAIDPALYLQRYPDLARLAENANENHLWRNVAWRCAEWTRRGSKRTQELANRMTKEDEFRLESTAPLLNHLGFAPIPVEEIGLYRDEFRP